MRIELTTLFVVLLALDARSQELPDNAVWSNLGNDWECQTGYRRRGSACVAVEVPENGKLTVFGNDWECKSGYHRRGTTCVAVKVPENAKLTALGNNWECVQGYKKNGEQCIPMTSAEIAAYASRTRAAIAAVSACGTSYNYDVTGDGDNGDVSGNIDACSKSKEVQGYLELEDGSEIEFEGEWVGNGEIEGYDDDGNHYYLEVD